MSRPSSREEDRPASPALPPNDILFGALDTARGIVLAVSGGPDSIALMHLAAAWADAGARPPLTVACVDHGLRSGSADEAACVAHEARALGLAVRTLVWLGEKPPRSIQEQAREARYRLLGDLAREIGASHLVTAHTLDDQTETVLFRMARGSGPAGLAGMRPVILRGALQHMRPFLGLRKDALIGLCRAHDWHYTEDPSNQNPAFARVRWRRLAPLLATEGLTAERVGRLAMRQARADDALRHIADLVAQAVTIEIAQERRTIAFEALARHPEEIVLRVIAGALAALGGRPDVRLSGLETLSDQLMRHFQQGLPLGRTLHRCRIRLGREGHLTLSTEAPRRRGLSPAPRGLR